VLLVLRSILFNLVFYLVIVLYVILALPFFFLSYRALVGFGKFWGRTNLWLLKVICGTDVAFRGVEKIPPGPLIVAAKHQSSWETFTLLLLFAEPAYIMKRELMWIPFFGWYLWKARMIPVDRGSRVPALRRMTVRVRRELARGRQIIIFPEGTRRSPGAPPAYKYGSAHLYAETGVPCVPVALNSGLFWGRRSFLRHPGTITVEILDPIPPGLDKETFIDRLEHEIECATGRLIADASRESQRPAA
jgi:1-acyl-sn-glycerol-3-phosphate acyltransferase